MRIALVTRSCPLAATDGIARQRQTLATALAARGHDVHLFTIGDRPGRTPLGRATIHAAVRTRHPNPWFAALPVLDWPLTDSQILYELVLREHGAAPFDVVDVPLWMAQGGLLLERPPCPVVLWLQTSLRHLIDLQAREPRAHEQVLLALEQRALDQAALVLGDSHAVLDDLQRLHRRPIAPSRARVVWPGLEVGEPLAERPVRPRVEILVVGRLEHRKGTPELLDLLPAILDARPDIKVTFVGADNSEGDGFKRAQGCTYPERFHDRYPAFADRVTFTGRVSDDDLHAAYRRADLLLHASRYESFGLVYLEAMRAGLPTVTFGVAGAREIHDATTARLVAADDWAGLCQEAVALAGDAGARARLGTAARARFVSLFSDEAMAERTLEAYAQAAAVVPPRATAPGAPGGGRAPACRIFQITEALQSPDGVGHIIRTQARLLAPLGGVAPVQTIYVQADLAKETGRVSATPFAPGDVAMLHFYGYSRLERLFAGLPSRRIVHYHNITPPAYFSPLSGAFEMTTRGLAQAPRLARLADLVTGDSEFNVRQFAAFLPAPRPTLALYPLVDRDRLLGRPVDRAFLAAELARTRDEGEAVLLFVGRFAPNKRQDLLVAAAGRLAANGSRPVRLVLVGSGDADPAFRAHLDRIVGRQPHLTVDLPGGVADDRLYAYYRVADVFLSASEHEGFGIPLAEAMAFGVPVVAAAHAAVPETLGNSGVLLRGWDEVRAAEAVARLLDDPARRDEVVRAQYRNLDRFSGSTLGARLRDMVQYLHDGSSGVNLVSSDVLLARGAS